MNRLLPVKHETAYLSIVCLCFLLLFSGNCYSRTSSLQVQKTNLEYSSLVNRLYQVNGKKLLWLDEHAPEKKIQLLNALDSITCEGLDKSRYHYAEIKNSDLTSAADTAALRKLDRIYTDAIIACTKDIYQGAGIQAGLRYDELTLKYESADNYLIVKRLLQIDRLEELKKLWNELVPHNDEYEVLKTEYRKQLLANKQKAIQVGNALNYYRWLFHFHFDKMIVVNIPSATLQYYEHNTAMLNMKVVVGKPSTRTPRFAAHCDKVILYPYWNVPIDIGLEELLPKFRRNPALIDAMNMQVVNGSGNVVNYHNIAWGRYGRSNFPYRFRQSTGCDNSLGVIKFDLTDPFTVYLHDTNSKQAFASAQRFFSHGCIRIQQPFELAGLILDNKLDTAFLKACMKNEKPEEIPIPKPVPVIVLYMTAAIGTSGTVQYHKDIYHLNK